MSILVDNARLSFRRNVKEIEDAMLRVTQFHLQCEDKTPDRRNGKRTPIQKLIRLFPLDSPSSLDGGEPIQVLTKNMSPHGFGFFHHTLISHRFALLTLQESVDREICFIAKLAWCRFLAPEWYESGGEIVKVSVSR